MTKNAKKRPIERATNFNDFYFSDWCRDKLPSPETGFMVCDIDIVLQNYKTKKIMFLEIKSKLAKPKQFQRHLFNRISKMIKIGIAALSGWKYLGFNLIQFENTTFDNGKVYINGIETTEKELIDMFSF